MKVSSISCDCFVQPKQAKKVPQHKKLEVPADQVTFRGVKGAGWGALGGLAYLGICAVIAAPFLPITAPIVLASAGAGALAGNGIEEAGKKDKDD